ncbi:MAG TPA: signal peptidase II [Tepidisphaeraceae bacterium]|nr:signal peptidase II [Tepidisphaeraceae bacterium]
MACRSPAAVLWFLSAFALLLTADLVSKRVSFDRLLIRQIGTPPAKVDIISHTVEFVPRVLHFHVTANQGAVFGLGQGKRWLFVLVSTGAIGYLLFLFSTLHRKHWPTQLLLAGFLAGVIGNMWDRLTFGYVRDMLWMFPQITWGDWLPFLPESIRRHDVFPWIFNLADSYLVTGVIVTIGYMLIAGERKVAPHISTDEQRLNKGETQPIEK